jgi:hypothetical protein
VPELEEFAVVLPHPVINVFRLGLPAFRLQVFVKIKAIGATVQIGGTT